MKAKLLMLVSTGKSNGKVNAKAWTGRKGQQKGG
jgi:hypothetical protein